MVAPPEDIDVTYKCPSIQSRMKMSYEQRSAEAVWFKLLEKDYCSKKKS